MKRNLDFYEFRFQILIGILARDQIFFKQYLCTSNIEFTKFLIQILNKLYHVNYLHTINLLLIFIVQRNFTIVVLIHLIQIFLIK